MTTPKPAGRPLADFILRLAAGQGTDEKLVKQVDALKAQGSMRVTEWRSEGFTEWVRLTRGSTGA